MDRNERRERLTEIFEDTRDFVWGDSRRSEDVKRKRRASKLYKEEADVALSEPAGKGELVFNEKRSFEAAMPYAAKGMKVAVHNFASAYAPGGGVRHGAGAQEECLCRCSDLYMILTAGYFRRNFYDIGRERNNPLNTDICIYTPDVLVFRTDTDFPEMMPEDDWYNVDVITCAAPNLKNLDEKLPDEELIEVYRKRYDAVFRAAADNKAEVVVTGAFGCGAYRNDPYLVSEGARLSLETYGRYFEKIVFAIYGRGSENSNYEIFRETLEK